MLHIRLFILLLILMLTGCANFNSIGRSTSLESYRSHGNKSTAIHLDAQQRLVLSKKDMSKICAEPSPDVMAAYAASLGLGVNVPTMGGGSLAQGGQSSTAGIGLRTQSITLMRDAFYRICEASMNDEISQVHVATLLGRGMDLTSVILAVEQLTGAVVAGQAILTGSSNASASSSGSEMLHANQQVLERATEYRDEKKTELDNSEERFVAKNGQVETQKGEFVLAKLAYDTEAAGAGGVSEPTKTRFRVEKEKLDKLVNEQEELALEVERKKKLHKEAIENVAAIENTKDATLIQMSTDASARTSSAGQINGITVNNLHSNNNADSIKHIAAAVSSMVELALKKDYSVESCLAYLSHEGTKDPDIKKDCHNLIAVKIIRQQQLLGISSQQGMPGSIP